jgi:hypothetical protein
MDGRRLTKEIYEADVGGTAGRGRPRRTLGKIWRRARSGVPETGIVYEEFDDSVDKKRKVFVRIVASGRK